MSPFVRKIGSRYVMRILRILLLLNFLLAPGATFSQDKRLASAYADAKALTPSDVPPIQALAKSGNVAAEFKLGLAYQLGLVVTKDDAEAEKWLRKAVEQGDPQAEYCLGLLLSGQRSRSQESQEWIRKAAEQEDPAAQWLLGMHLQLAKDNASALKWFRAAADQGLDQAQVAVGYYYEKGVVVPQDFGMAAKWYRLAADQGLAVAQSNLGNFYVRGNGVPQDFNEAAMLFGRAAQSGWRDGQANFAGLYIMGKGVPRDYVTAYMWASLAAEQGQADAARGLKFLTDRMTKSDIDEAKNRAQAWRREHSQQTHISINTPPPVP